MPRYALCKFSGCSREFIVPYGSNQKFCCRSCRAKVVNTTRTKQYTPESLDKLRVSLKKNKETNHDKWVTQTNKRKIYVGEHTKLYGYKTCTCCQQKFWALAADKRCCSPECSRKNSTYRKIVHEYVLEGEILWLESSWEIEIADYLNSLKIRWIRPKHIPWIDRTGKRRRYFPDFYLPDFDLYLDPKNNYQIELTREKLDIVSSSVKLIYGSVSYIKDNLADLPGIAPRSSESKSEVLLLN